MPETNIPASNIVMTGNVLFDIGDNEQKMGNKYEGAKHCNRALHSKCL